MTLDEQLEQLAGLRYPRQVDVVERVMARVATLPQPQARTSRPLWPRAATVAAAAVAVLFVVGIATPLFRPYDEEGMGTMLAQVNDYGSWSSIEEAAENPYESLYDE